MSALKFSYSDNNWGGGEVLAALLVIQWTNQQDPHLKTQIHSQAHLNSATCVVGQPIMFKTASFGMQLENLLRDCVLTKKHVKEAKNPYSNHRQNENLRWRLSHSQKNPKLFGLKSMKRAGLMEINQRFRLKMKYRLSLQMRYRRTSISLIHSFLIRLYEWYDW